MNEYLKKRYHERRNKLIEMLGGKCNNCGSIINLQFDHVDYKEKKYSLAKIISTWKWETILQEAQKCQLLCMECHGIKSKPECSVQKLGARNPNSKLNEDIVREIKERLTQGESGYSLAKIFGVNKVTIYDIKSGKTWSHVGA